MKKSKGNKDAALAKTGAAAMAQATRGRARVFDNKKIKDRLKRSLPSNWMPGRMEF